MQVHTENNRKELKNQMQEKENDSSMSKYVLRISIIIALDALLIAFSYFFALLVRFDFSFSHIDAQYLNGFRVLILPYILLSIGVFWLFRLYHSIWKFASVSELGRMICAWIVIQALVVGIYLWGRIRMPISFWVVGATMGFMLTTGLRFSYRFLRIFRMMLQQKTRTYGEERVLVIGAGSAGKTIIHELFTSAQLPDKVCCVIDDNPIKKGRYLDGVRIVGDRSEIMKAAKKYMITKIIFAIPSASARDRKEILDICQATGCKVQAVPGIYQLVDGRVSVSKLRDVQIEDLLGRDQVKVNMDDIHHFIYGKVVLVTGGGGSIGSELCRQIARDKPKLLIIFDIYENNAYEIQMELVREYGDKLALETLIGSVRNTNRVNWVMETYRPDIVFHAAAHKHVPLMEESPNEAIKNNVIGTYKLAKAAMEYHVQRFVMISTDKAVNPTSLMGASKRICEMIVQMMGRKSAAMAMAGREEKTAVEGDSAMMADGLAEAAATGEAENAVQSVSTDSVSADSDSGQTVDVTRYTRQDTGSVKKPVCTEFVAVRFGNVLGSNGSVIPLFKEQIAAGGPVTVTDPRMIRYFMTIPEAVALVLQASYYAQGGEIFVLDMGEPVKIDDMARKLIRLSGYEPDVDIKVQYTGLRPGEKLYEEMLMDEEGLKETPNKLIHVGEPIKMDDAVFLEELDALMEASREESPVIKDMVAKMVPTYIRDEQNKQSDKEREAEATDHEKADVKSPQIAATMIKNDNTTNLFT